MPETEETVNIPEAPPKPRRRGPDLRPLLFILVLAALVGAFLAGTQLHHVQDSPEPVITSELLGEQLQGVQELVSLDYHYRNMGKYENQLDFYGWKVPFTSKSFLVAYDGLIKAGVDMSAASVFVDELERRVTITLPGSQVLSHEILEDSLEVFDESRNIFNPITIENYNDFTKDQKASVEQRAIDNGLLLQADEQAREAVRSLLQFVPGIETYRLIVQ